MKLITCSVTISLRRKSPKPKRILFLLRVHKMVGDSLLSFMERTFSWFMLDFFTILCHFIMKFGMCSANVVMHIWHKFYLEIPTMH